MTETVPMSALLALAVFFVITGGALWWIIGRQDQQGDAIEREDSTVDARRDVDAIYSRYVVTRDAQEALMRRRSWRLLYSCIAAVMPMSFVIIADDVGLNSIVGAVAAVVVMLGIYVAWDTVATPRRLAKKAVQLRAMLSDEEFERARARMADDLRPYIATGNGLRHRQSGDPTDPRITGK